MNNEYVLHDVYCIRADLKGYQNSNFMSNCSIEGGHKNIFERLFTIIRSLLTKEEANT